MGTLMSDGYMAYQNRIRELHGVSDELARRSQIVEATKAELNRAQAVGNVGSWIYDIANDTMRLSSETCRIFGLPEGTLGTYASYVARAHAKDRSALESAWHEAQKKKKDFDYEHRIVVGGAIRWVRQKAEFEFASDGTVHRAVGVAQEITQRKQTEELLRESEERWKFAIEGSGDGVWDWNLQTGEAIFSRRWKEMLGFSEAEIRNHSEEWVKRVFPEDMPDVMAKIQAHVDGKAAAANVEFRMLSKDGSWKWMLGRGIVVRRDVDGKPLRLVPVWGATNSW